MMQLLLTALCVIAIAIQEGIGVPVSSKDDVDNQDGKKVEESDDTSNKAANVMAGFGYSQDSQRIVAQKCYSVSTLATYGEQSILKLAEVTSFSNLESELGMDVSLEGKFGMFSASAEATYLRAIEENQYSISLNYYEYATNEVKVEVNGYGIGALNEFGFQAYKDGNNSRFGLVCGDSYISSYKQGTLLIMGLVIKLNSAQAKNKFSSEVGASFGNIGSASTKIEKIVKENQITGTVTVHAFQMGGEPSQLSKLLSKDERNKFYLMTCSLSTMDKCKEASNGLLAYAEGNYPLQFSFQDNFGLTPFGVVFSQYETIENIGLVVPGTYVTREVQAYRIELSKKMKECESIIQTIVLIDDRTRNSTRSDNFFENVEKMRLYAEKNRSILVSRDGGAADCFTKPDKCIRVTKPNIDSQLHNFTKAELDSLKIN